MARRRAVRAPVDETRADLDAPAPLPEDDFVQSLRGELSKAQRTATTATQEDLSHRAEINRRLLQDCWEIHNQFEQISVHLSVEPSQTLFATFVEYPEKWSFRDNFDFGAVKAVELKDRAPGWVGFGLRFWYYRTDEGKPHLRGIYEWCEGESYHRYSGWMRQMNQAVLYDSNEHSVDFRQLHQVLKDVVVHWYQAHLDKGPEPFIGHLKEKYPKGASYAREAYRG